MISLMDRLGSLASEATQQLATLTDEAAPALAYARPAAENHSYIVGVLDRIVGGKRDAGLLTSAVFVAAMAALPDTAFETMSARMRSLVMANQGFARQVGLRDLNQRIKRVRSMLQTASRQMRDDGSGTILLDPDDNLGMARQFLERHQMDGFSTLVVYGGAWFRYEPASGVYHRLDIEVLNRLVYEFLETGRVSTRQGPEPIMTNPGVVQNILHAAATLVHLPTHPDGIFWRDAGERQRPAMERCVFFRNAALAVDPWLAGSADAVIDHTPALFITERMPVDLDLNAICPQFEGFMATICDSDEQRIRAVQLLAGYWLLPDTSLQTVAAFQGPPGTGKGTLVRILRKVYGPGCAAPCLEQLGTLWGYEDLLGAKLAILSDAHEVGDRAGSAVEKLLAISGEDEVNVHRKNEKSLRSQRLTTRLLLVLNESIGLPDKASALHRRLVLIPFTRQLMDRAEDSVSDRLMAEESAGIARWFLEGLRLLEHLRSIGRSSGVGSVAMVRKHLQPVAGLPELERLREMGSAVLCFIRECCVLGNGHAIPTDDLYGMWQHWAENSGYHRRSKAKFVADIIAATKNAVRESQPVDAHGARPRVLNGIDLLQPARQSLGTMAILAVRHQFMPSALATTPPTTVETTATMVHAGIEGAETQRASMQPASAEAMPVQAMQVQP